MTTLIKPGKIKKIGAIKAFRTPKGGRIILLPTCDVPPEHLIPENWETTRKIGNMRDVTAIETLKDGTNVALICKQPERHFLSDQAKVREGTFWILARQKDDVVAQGKAVEAMANLEAKMLMALAWAGVHAEKPLAICINPDGTKSIVVKKIHTNTTLIPRGQQSDKTAHLERQAIKAGFTPRDTARNYLFDRQSVAHFIDVNRWKAGRLSTRYHKNLIKAILAEIERKNKAEN